MFQIASSCLFSYLEINGNFLCKVPRKMLLINSSTYNISMDLPHRYYYVIVPNHRALINRGPEDPITLWVKLVEKAVSWVILFLNCDILRLR